MKNFPCDYQDCPMDAVWHIEDNGAPWETNACACNEHLHDLCDPLRKSVVQRITADNEAEIVEKRA